MTETCGTCYQSQIATLLDNATKHWRTSNYAAAEKECRAALAIAKEHLGKETRAYGLCLNDLGIMLTAQGKVDEAREVFIEALHVLEKILGSGAAEVDMIFGRLHDLYY